MENILVIDIETVPCIPDFNNLSPALQHAWESKTAKNREEGKSIQAHYFQNAGIYAEFGKVICLSAGAFYTHKKTHMLSLRLKSFAGHDEKKLLLNFSELLNLHYNDMNKHLLCAHNGKEFDFPYLCRRMLVNGLMLPKLLNIPGLKPWEVPHLDTMELWKFGDRKNFTSLNLLTAIFNLPSPKTDLDGSQVARVYWEEDGLERITHYCQQDVLAVAQLLLKFKGIPLLREEDITIAE